MLQCEMMEKKSSGAVRCKDNSTQKNKSIDKPFSVSGFDADTSQTVQCMQIKYSASPKPIKSVLQMNVANARRFRTIATNIANDPNADYGARTVGVSNHYFAITPQLRNSQHQATAQANSGNRNYAEAVEPHNRDANHAEKKLIHYDAGLKEIGVTRDICQSCVNAICAKAGTIEHVSEPGNTYRVTARELQRVGN